jgi:hypothetical protein
MIDMEISLDGNEVSQLTWPMTRGNVPNISWLRSYKSSENLTAQPDNQGLQVHAMPFFDNFTYMNTLQQKVTQIKVCTEGWAKNGHS